MCHQAIPVAGILSDLEVAMERCYNIGYGPAGKEEGITGEARPKNHPVLQTNRSKEHGAWGNHQITSPKESPRPELDPSPT